MKAAAFDYVVATNADDALEQMAQGGDDAMILAGGQTLVPMLAMRLARPAILIDINGVSEWSGIEIGNGNLQIKTCTRQASAMNSPEISEHLPLLAKALPFVGHQQTRNRGTIGGSVVHGDPAAEIPLVSVALDAEITLRSTKHSRQISAEDFFEGPMMNAREADECLSDISFPIWEHVGNFGCDFQEVSQRYGDFAVVSAAAQLILDNDGVCQRAAIAIGGVSGVPVRLKNAESILTTGTMTADLIEQALLDMEDALDPADDQAASADYRRRVARVMAERVIREAATEAGWKTA